MYARVKLQLKNREHTLTLPFAALSVFKNEYFVYKVVDNYVEKKPITMGIKSKDYFEILDSDISADDLIIISGKELINDGMKVITVKSDG